MEVHVLGPFQENCYRVTHVPSGRSVVVDPGFGPETALAAIARGAEAILLTHGHMDHVAGLPAARKASLAPVWAGCGEGAVLADPLLNGSGRWPELFPQPLQLPPPDRELADGDEVPVGGGRARALLTPGHEPFHVAYGLLSPGGEVVAVLAGDTLFQGSIGRTDLPGGDLATLVRSIHEKLFALPDEVLVLPGHGPHTTIGRERRENPFVGRRGSFPPPE
ncbi:MAG: MBL fold metallo-hydrolase [Clostridia bacterium]|nr:MBL fold metallo-hydrolase [Clostridia bacterium]